jgi:ABC-2 type transport system permease protein
MMQVLLFFFATLAMAEPGKPIEWAAMIFPLSSPFAMLARAAQHEDLWPHVVAIVWQLAWVMVFIRFGAALFRKRVMKSGPQGAKKRSLWKRGAGAATQAAGEAVVSGNPTT